MKSPTPERVVYRAKAMRLKGLTWDAIGAALGHHPDTLRYRVYMAWPNMERRRNAVVVTAAQVAIIRDMFAQGRGPVPISERTGLSKKVILREIARLGLTRATPVPVIETRRCLGHDDASADGRCTKRLPKNEPLFLCPRCSPSSGRSRLGKDHHV